MNILELDSYNLADTVKFHDRLNPRLWDSGEHLRPEVKAKLMQVALDFQEFLGVPDLDVKDITISGSNAAFNYTPGSDIDLHLVIDIPNVAHDEVYRELFNAKKYQYNDEHDIRIRDADVELYAQDSAQPHHSQGIYSLLRNSWLSVPKRTRAEIDDVSTRSKFEDLAARIDDVIKSQDLGRMDSLMTKIKTMRQTGLEKQGEFGSDNLAFKLLRNNGYIERLIDAKQAARDQELSLAELAQPRQKVRYGFGESPDGVDPTTKMFLEEPIDESPDGVNPTTAMFLTEVDTESVVQEFIQHTAERLGIERIPEIIIHHDPDWSESNHSFGMYVPNQHKLHVSLGDRHLLDVLRTTAHELCHCAQQESAPLPDEAGDTGSAWENEANAVAGIVMRDFANAHPEYFQQNSIKESASGYIPTKAQAKDPRYSMALTVDIKPGQLGKEANKLNLKTDSQGKPGLLIKSANLQESLAAEFAMFESQDLFEINMGSKNLRREAAQTGAIAGMEFEMIVPNVEGDPGDEDLEPDYDYDQRCRSIQDAYDFFYDGDFNSRRSCDEMRDSMRNDYTEWLDQKISDDWDSGGEEYIYQWVKENVDESEWNPEEKSDLGRTEALEEYAANVHADPVSDQYQSAYEEFREENQECYDESDWLDDADLSSMREIGDSYSMDWPHWSSPYSGGEANIEDVAQEFENAIGRDVRASDNYHSGSTLRPSVANQRYIVEPDGSLEADNPGDRGLEFVSPPLPIDEILGDLNKVRTWAKEYGCYTNDSTGLHINISVPDYSLENLDFVKLALLMGDKYVLNAFGRTGNTYAKSAMGIIKDAVRNKPEDAARLLDKMKGNLDQLATKAIHSGITAKYTSINTKDGHIEFRSPGGDWLDQNFDQIENTLLRFTVAMSAALNPDAYRQEYLTKLYKMLTEDNKGDDTIKYFADYVAGKIPKAALRSFIKQAQLQRNIRRGKATDQKPNDGTYELFDRRTGETIPDTEFSARNQSDVNTRVDDYVNHGQHGLSTIDARLLFGARPVDSNSATRPYVVTMPANPNFRLPVTASSSEEAIQLIRDGDPDLRFADLEARPVSAPADDADQETLPNPLRPTGPGPWEVYNRQTGNSTVNLIQNGQPITDRGAAQRQAMALISTGRHDLYGVRTIGTESNSNWRIIYGATGETLNTVSGASRDQALAVLHDTARRNGVRPDVLSLQPAPASDDIPEVPVDVAQNFPPDRTDGRDTNYSFRDLFGTTDQASSAPAGNSFSGQWRVMLDGEEVWRFRGVGNNQADANRIAQTWLQDQRSQGLLSPAPGADVEVVPIMVESVQQHVKPAVAEGLDTKENPDDQVRNKLNAWMEQDQQFTDPTQRASFQAQDFWPYIQQNIKTILADKGEKGNGDYPAAPYAAWLLVQHMDAYPQNQIEFYNALKQAIPDHPKIQFLRDRAAVNQWIIKNASNPEYFINGKPLPNPTVNVRNPDMFKDAGIVATSREEALQNAQAAGNKLLVAAVQATNAQTQPSYKQGVAEGKVKLHTDPGYFGAEVDDTGFDSLPVVNIPTNQLVGFEPDSKMNQPKSQANVEKIVAGLKKGDKLPPLLVRKYKNGYQVLDGHHRFWAYKLSGTKSIPVRIVADKDIEEIGEQGVTEGVYRGDWVRHPDNPWQIGQIQSIDNGQAAVTWKKTDKRKKAMSSTHAVDALQHARREFSQLTQPTHSNNDLIEIAAMPAHQFAGGKDMLGMFQTPAKKHLKPLPGGTDLQYAIESNRYGTIVQIVDPGMPGITRPEVVAVLNLDSSSLPNTVQVGSITVDEDYRGRGLARALYGIVLTIMQKNLVSGSSQTPGGRRNWMSLASIPGVEVQGLVRIPNQIFDLERTATVSPQWRKYADRTVDQIMELGGQFYSKDNNSTYWLFDVVPGKGSLQPAVKNALSRLYGYDSDNLLLATWTGA